MVYSIINGVVCRPSKQEESLIRIITEKKYKPQDTKTPVKLKQKRITYA